jgi:hypothetical protein
MNVPFVELSFGVIGRTLPADHGYGLYSAITPFLLCGSLESPSILQGVEHYARIGTLFQSLSHRCRKAFITQTLLFQVSDYIKSILYMLISVCMHGSG